MKTEKEIRTMLKHLEQVAGKFPDCKQAKNSIALLRQILEVGKPEVDKMKVYKLALEGYGVNAQMVMTMEECAELTKELSKIFRGFNCIYHQYISLLDRDYMKFKTSSLRSIFSIFIRPFY